MISFLISSTICLSVLLLFYHFVLRKESMFVFNRFFLLGSLVFSLMIPLINLPPVFPTLNSSGQNTDAEIQQTILATVIQLSDEKNPVISPNHVNPKSEIQVVDWFPILISVYLIGFLFFILRFIFQILSIYKLVKNGTDTVQERHSAKNSLPLFRSFPSSPHSGQSNRRGVFFVQDLHWKYP